MGEQKVLAIQVSTMGSKSLSSSKQNKVLNSNEQKQKCSSHEQEKVFAT